MTLRRATADREEPVVRTSSSARCIRKPPSLPGSWLTCDLISCPESTAAGQAIFLRSFFALYLLRSVDSLLNPWSSNHNSITNLLDRTEENRLKSGETQRRSIERYADQR